MEQETEKIIEFLRKMRIEKKISVLNLATSVGISHSHLYYIESKRVIPSVDVVVKIAKMLEVSLSSIFE
ncbi:MAG: helix-turn-helix domain-containing protein [Spirochaetaceae bacterium]|nr:helix-turn-helix domain-containing protein [Spirochaetaceae bacterium]